MIIDWRIIPHKEQRYDTVGDWWWDGDTLNLRVSQMSDRRYEWLVGIHEVIECFLCKFAGKDPKEIDEWDKAYEAARAELPTYKQRWKADRLMFGCGCEVTDDSEPGDDKHAPYFAEHGIASGIERLLGAFLGVNWGEYNREVMSL